MSFLNLFSKPAESISDAITSKLKTPFIGIFSLVWIIRKRILIYNLFFDTESDKLKILTESFNFSKVDFWVNFSKTVIVSLIILFFYYIAVNISRVLTAISEDKLKLAIFKALGSKRFVSTESYNSLKSLFTKVSTEKEILESKSRSYNDSLKSKDVKFLELSQEKNKSELSLTKNIVDLENTVKRLEKNLNGQENKNLKLNQELTKTQRDAVSLKQNLKEFKALQSLSKEQIKTIAEFELNILSKNEVKILDEARIAELEVANETLKKEKVTYSKSFYEKLAFIGNEVGNILIPHGRVFKKSDINFTKTAKIKKDLSMIINIIRTNQND